MALEGTVNTPLGHVSKKTAVIGGGFVVIIAAVVYYRAKKASDAANAAATAATAGANTGIDPATGYAYGSAEDAAALANQGSYIDPNSLISSDGLFGGYYGGGGTSIPSSSTPSPGSFTNNAQWAQYVETTLVANSSVADATALSAAIGKYLSGQPVTSDQQSLVQQAIAFGGLPPQSGANGYPPSINTSAVTNPTPLAAPTVTANRSGGGYGFSVYYAQPAGAKGVNLYQSDNNKLINYSPATMNYIGTTGLKPNTSYSYYLAAVDSNGVVGAHSPNFIIHTASK